MNDKKEIKRNKYGFIDIEIKDLIEWNEPNGEGCLVSDKITKEGYKVGYKIGRASCRERV